MEATTTEALIDTKRYQIATAEIPDAYDGAGERVDLIIDGICTACGLNNAGYKAINATIDPGHRIVRFFSHIELDELNMMLARTVVGVADRCMRMERQRIARMIRG